MDSKFWTMRYRVFFAVAVLVMSGARLCAGAEVSLTWDHSPSSFVSAYRVYYGTVSGNYHEFVQVSWPRTTLTIRNLTPEATYYFSAKAVGYYSEEVESD